MSNKIIAKDTLFMISSGEYSDYFPRGAYKAHSDIDIDAELQDATTKVAMEPVMKWENGKFIDSGKKRFNYTFDFGKFLEDKGLISSVELAEVHTHSYDFTTDKVTYKTNAFN